MERPIFTVFTVRDVGFDCRAEIERETEWKQASQGWVETNKSYVLGLDLVLEGFREVSILI